MSRWGDAVNMKGQDGEVRYGYQVAARLGAWEASPKSNDVLALSADLREVDEYWITQEPLDLAVRVGRTEWRWGGVAVVRDGKWRLHVDLRGRPEVQPL